MRILARFGVLGLLMLLGACQTLSGLETPEVNLSSIRLEQVSVFEQQWQVVLRARNPNDRELTLKSLDYELFVNGVSNGTRHLLNPGRTPTITADGSLAQS